MNPLNDDKNNKIDIQNISIVYKDAHNQLYVFSENNIGKQEKQKAYIDKNNNFFTVYNADIINSLQKLAPRKTLYKFIENKEADVMLFGENFEEDIVLIKYIDRKLGKKERNEFEKEYEKIFKNKIKTILIVNSTDDTILKNNKYINIYYHRLIETCRHLYFGTLLEADVFLKTIIDIAKYHMVFLKSLNCDETEEYIDEYNKDSITNNTNLLNEKIEILVDYFEKEDFYSSVVYLESVFYDFSYDTIYNFITGAIIFMFLNIDNKIKVQQITSKINDYQPLLKWIYDKDTIIKINKEKIKEESEI